MTENPAISPDADPRGAAAPTAPTAVRVRFCPSPTGRRTSA
ncbi:MAG: hypothetical protein U0Q19_21870 [Kineosporiaceae bacterium]